MSSYVNFYIKSKKTEEFIAFDSWSRSNTIYQIFKDFLFYEKGKELTEELLSKVQNNLNKEINIIEERINNMQEEIDFLKSLEGSIEEKMEHFNILKNYLAEEKDTISDYHFAQSFITFLNGIINKGRYDEDGGTIWAGIEWNPNCKEENE